jgi:hypothetical protein
MAAPIGNEYYKVRLKHGRDKAYTPESLLEKANEYFQWCLDNPLYEAVIVKGSRVEQTETPMISKDGKKTSVKSKVTQPYDIAQLPKMRVFSIQGLCNFSDITRVTFLKYDKDKDFINITTRIRGIIENQQFEGASSGQLNQNIIARILGLIDRKENHIKGIKLGKSYEAEYE